MELRLETYTPSEAEAITAVKQATVRNWRRAGHLPRQEGHARYNLADILVMFSMGVLVASKIPPEAAKEFAGELARAVFKSAIWSPKAFSGDVLSAAKDELGKIADEEVCHLKDKLGDNFSIEVLETARCQEIMSKAAEKLAGISGVKHPTWLIVWANGEMEFYYDEDISDERFFGNTVFDAYVKGPVTLFCLGALAQEVIDRLPRPAIRLAEEAQ